VNGLCREVDGEHSGGAGGHRRQKQKKNLQWSCGDIDWTTLGKVNFAEETSPEHRLRKKFWTQIWRPRGWTRKADVGCRKTIRIGETGISLNGNEPCLICSGSSVTVISDLETDDAAEFAAEEKRDLKTDSHSCNA
jgi:hypothetical protein